jgi:hypothetical protein
MAVVSRSVSDAKVAGEKERNFVQYFLFCLDLFVVMCNVRLVCVISLF